MNLVCCVCTVVPGEPHDAETIIRGYAVCMPHASLVAQGEEWAWIIRAVHDIRVRRGEAGHRVHLPAEPAVIPPRDADHAWHWLYERAEEAAASGLPLEAALEAVRNGYSSIDTDRIVAEDP